MCDCVIPARFEGESRDAIGSLSPVNGNSGWNHCSCCPLLTIERDCFHDIVINTQKKTAVLLFVHTVNANTPQQLM